MSSAAQAQFASLGFVGGLRNDKYLTAGAGELDKAGDFVLCDLSSAFAFGITSTPNSRVRTLALGEVWPRMFHMLERRLHFSERSTDHPA